MTGRVAIVTGGGTGIGAATVRVLAEHGASVVLASRRLENLQSVAGAVSSATGARCLPIVTDIRREQDVVAMVRAAVDAFGKIDILVNNAGGTRLEPLETLSAEQWDKVVSVNLRGAFLCTREAGRHMLAAGRGAIVNISSGAGLSGVKGGAHYSAAKAGLQMFTRVVAAEWGPRGIRANCLAVGAIPSPRAIEAWKVAGIDPAAMAARAPLNRLGTPEEVALSVLYLASDASAYVTGQTFAVDGGPVVPE